MNNGNYVNKNKLQFSPDESLVEILNLLRGRKLAFHMFHNCKFFEISVCIFSHLRMWKNFHSDGDIFCMEQKKNLNSILFLQSK